MKNIKMATVSKEPKIGQKNPSMMKEKHKPHELQKINGNNFPEVRSLHPILARGTIQNAKMKMEKSAFIMLSFMY